MTTQINLNGEIGPDAFISVLDHGFLFGDSIYEVVVTHKGVPCFMMGHLKRLRNSAAGLSMEIPWSDEHIVQQIDRTVTEAGNEESYIRVIVTRGVGELDIDPTSCSNPELLVLVKELKPYPQANYEKGINVALVSVKRNSRDTVSPGIKTGNYLNNVLAKLESNSMGAQDALMLNHEGHLTECTTSNFFFVSDGRIMTPSLECGILAGITRDVLLQVAQENGVLVEEGEWPPDSLIKADEAFITGTVKKVMPVTHLDGRPFGDGQPGPVTRRMMRLYDEALSREADTS
ncbi:MAG: branched-chain-amino acid aminotransferase [Candidatus Nitronauta litoralis]|uniref:branched-chain-amino-acid transaminase n=1 Tax=Candidatus Nitronauta litoralis TaxID=2705533 RepID=A0A7T0BYP4_9BACT|nr:MAG: branched-chain-amino acid aminotransferase [Candidatus Nitronauta litoralis]